MKQRLFSLVDWTRRHYRHARGERVLLITFWPQDYRRGTVYPVSHPTYRITRYVHAADQHLFEV